MTRPAGSILLFAVVLAAAGCRQTKGQSAVVRDTAALAARQDRFAENMRRTADSGGNRSEPLARWVLPKMLSEISGIALTPDGRLLAHNDESGLVFEIDYRRGMVVKQFMIGKQMIREDFEAITIVGQRIFLLASNGKLYEFREGKDGDRVPFVVHDTKLGRECEFEGLGYDSTASSLLLACKNIGIKGLRDFVLVYRWKVDGGAETSELKVPLPEVIGSNGWKDFKPSDMAVDPLTGNYVLVSAQEQGLVSVTPAGALIFSRPLPKGHPMAEGLAITRDSILIVSDEGVRGAATITLYRWP